MNRQYFSWVPGHRVASILVMWLGLVFMGSAHAQLIISSIPDSPDPVPAGGVVTYGVRVAETNGSPLVGGAFAFSVPANGVYAGTGGLPAGVSCTGMFEGQSGPGVLNCSGIELSDNQVLAIPLRVRSVGQGTLSVTATPSPGGTPQTEVTTVNAGADLELAIAGPANASAGSTQTYTFSVLNRGPDAASGASLTYSLPPGFAPSATPAGCSIGGSVLSCSLGAIALNGTSSVSVTGVIGAGGGSTVTHTADVAATGGVSDGIADNNTASLSTVVAPGSSLAIGKTKSVADPVSTGTPFNFTLTPRYSGDYPVGVAVQDNVPAAFCFAGPATSFTSGAWSCTASSQCPSAAPVVSCTHGGSGVAGANVPLGDIVLPVQAIATASGAINTATISAPGVASNDGSVATTVIDPVADLRANKARSWPQAAVPLNTPFNYTLSTTNLGPTPFPASGVITITDNLPAGLQLDSISPPAGFTCSSSAGGGLPQAGALTVTCVSSGVGLAVNATTPNITLGVRATTAGAPLVNNACVASSGGPVDDAAGNNCASVSVTPQATGDQADLSTLKRVLGIGDAPGNRQLAGEPITWEIEVVNAGPNTATDVAVTDVIDKVFNAQPSQYGIATVPGAATLGSCGLTASGANVSLDNCRIANLPVCTVGVDCPRIQVTVRHFGDGTAGNDTFQVTNSAFALAQNQGDANLDNNTSPTATAYFEARADVAVSKSDNPDPVPAGQLLTYTITASNPAATSGSAAYAVSISDTLPLDVVFLSATASGGGTCTTTPGANATTTPANRTLVCGWPSIARGGQQTVTVQVRVLASNSVVGGGSGSVSNSVTVSTTTPEIAGGGANNSATQATTVTSPVYDLLVNKTDDADPVNVGDDVTYTLTASNNGASTAENVRLVDTLPTGTGAPTFVEVVSPLPAGMSCDTSGVTVGAAGGSVVCTIDRLGGVGTGATGEPFRVEVRIRLRGADKGQYTNQASVSLTNPALNALDPAGNNSVGEPTTFRYKADVQVVSKRAVRPGTDTPITEVATAQVFDWLVDVRNNGPQAAETTTFSDTLPAGLVLADAPTFTITAGSFTPAAISCTGAAGDAAVSCAIASMPANGTATVRLPVRFATQPANGFVITNTARIVTTGSGDTNGGANPNAGNNFGTGSLTVQSSAISGRVYHDQNANGTFDGGEPGIASTLTLTGTDNWGQPVNLSVTSDASTGAFAFNVPPGTYTLTQTQPAGFDGGITRAGAVSGAGSAPGSVPTSGPGVTSGPNGSNANTIQTIVLGSGGTSSDNLFGEVQRASLAGRVYQDADYNGAYSASDPGLGNVGLELSGTDLFGNPVSLSATSAPGSGQYSFPNLWPGSYAVAQPTQPSGFADGAETVGSAGGSNAVNERISGIALGSGVAATGYDFGEQLTRVQVRVFEDLNNDGQVQPGESGITGVTLRLTGTDASGNAVDIVATPVAGQPGRYEFLNTPPSGPGGYTITETQPGSYAPGKASANGQPGTAQAGGNTITGVTVAGGANVPLTQGDYLFGELTDGQIRGRVHFDRDGNGQQTLPGEPGVAGVTVTLSGTDANGNSVSLLTTTDANGDYAFTQVPPGTYAVEMVRPAGYLPGLTTAGTVSGSGSVAGSVPTSGSGVTSGPNGSDANRIQSIVLGSPGAGSSGNHFSLVRAASLAGSVYLDLSPANGVRDAGERGVAGAAVAVSGTDFYGQPVSRSLTTDADGRYSVSDLLPGTYQIDETQPNGLLDGTESLGTVNGAARGSANPGGVNDRFGGIVLASEEAGVDYHFGEIGGQLAGHVYVDANDNGQLDAGEPGIAGVRVTLTGTAANGSAVSLVAITDANGRYVFDGLLPSDASGYTLTETQPLAYADGRDTAGRIGGVAMGTAGNDTITGIVYTGGNGDGYLFGERAASIAGSVFNDVAGNGVREPGDLPIPGVTITLTGNDASGNPVTRTVISGADGSYRFDNLPLSDGAGYTLTQTQPGGFAQGGELIGSLGGSVGVPNTVRVPLTTPGAQGTGYDFWEQLVAPAAISGTVWRDDDHDRQRSPGEALLGGWTVELLVCANGAATCAPNDQIALDRATTAPDGSYRFANVVPGDYQLRFRSPSGQVIGGVWPTDPVLNAPAGALPTTPGMRPLIQAAVSVAPGANVVNQDLPLDPSGVVYDSVTAQPVAGAVVSFNGPPGFDPAVHLLGGSNTVTTASDGHYQFLLLPGAPAGEYTIGVTPPSGYLNSTVYLPADGPLNAQTCTAPGGQVDPVVGDPCVVSTPAPVAGVPSPYFLRILIPVGGAQNVVNNHLPLDPGDGSLIELRKTTPKLTVKKGELVPYVVTARNTRQVAIADVVLVDTVPPGFKYVAGSLTVQRLPNGPVESVVPAVDGRRLTLPPRAFGPGETLRVAMVLGVGTGVGEGVYVNQVIAQQAASQAALSRLATASVRVVPDALFDCTDVIGKVYDDRNANGYQDEGEPGIPNVRLATVNGLLVTTDAQGRFHIACATVPKEGSGSNFVLKLDERTLPSGYRVTTENPAAERATRGKLVKINFGTTVHRVVRLDLRADAFEPGRTALQAAFAAELGGVIEALQERPSILRLAYHAAAGEPQALGRERAQAVKAELLQRWQRHGAAQQRALFNLDIEVELLPPSVAP